ncbi:MAG: Dabb family protein [Pseudomonadota bacterium]|nr:MAG: stress responsive protein [Pseudomonadota bacterium]
MVKHVVLWKLRGDSPEERRDNAERVRAALRTLAGKIPGMSSLEVGIATADDPESADVVLITTHESWQALETYRSHPEHQVVARLIGELRVERRVVDFEA